MSTTKRIKLGSLQPDSRAALMAELFDKKFEGLTPKGRKGRKTKPQPRLKAVSWHPDFLLLVPHAEITDWLSFLFNFTPNKLFSNSFVRLESITSTFKADLQKTRFKNGSHFRISNKNQLKLTIQRRFLWKRNFSLSRNLTRQVFKSLKTGEMFVQMNL